MYDRNLASGRRVTTRVAYQAFRLPPYLSERSLFRSTAHVHTKSGTISVRINEPTRRSPGETHNDVPQLTEFFAPQPAKLNGTSPFQRRVDTTVTSSSTASTTRYAQQPLRPRAHQGHDVISSSAYVAVEHYSFRRQTTRACVIVSLVSALRSSSLERQQRAACPV